MGCTVSLLAVVLLLRQVSLADLLQVLGRALPGFMLLAVLTVVAALVARAARWQVFFLPTQRVPFGPLLGTLSVSYMASTFLPFRAGEIVRAVFLGQRTRLGLPRIVATIVLEKLFDFLAIGLLLVGLVFTTPLPTEAIAAAGVIAGVILGGFGFVLALAILRTPTLRLLARVQGLLPFGLGARLGLVNAATQFAAGTDSLRVSALWPGLLGWTAAAWVLSLLTGWFSSLALGVSPTVSAIVFMTVFTSVGQAAPSSPGYVGVYHAAAYFALTAFGVEPSSALAIAVLTHALSYGTLVLAGLVALWGGGYAAGDVLATARGKHQAPRQIGPTPTL